MLGNFKNFLIHLIINSKLVNAICKALRDLTLAHLNSFICLHLQLPSPPLQHTQNSFSIYTCHGFDHLKVGTLVKSFITVILSPLINTIYHSGFSSVISPILKPSLRAVPLQRSSTPCNSVTGSTYNLEAL